MKQVIMALAAIGLAGCATSGEDAIADRAGVPSGAEAMICNAESAQAHIGHNATQAGGAVILKESGARTLRWGPPRSAWTMDYRQDRVNVRYDDAMKIIEVTCG